MSEYRYTLEMRTIFEGDKGDRSVTGFIMRYPIGAVILLLIKFSREFED